MSKLANKSSRTRSRNTPFQARLISPKGRINITRIGVIHSPLSDLYHWLLTIPWMGFWCVVVCSYTLANVFFALLYSVSEDGIENAQPHSFSDAFFFSVQTMASIGYGAMYPNAPYTNIIVTIEALVGLLGLALATGLLFARFSRPTAKILFSQVAVITTWNGLPALMFRSANQRNNQILEAEMRATLVRDEVDDQGYYMRRFYDMELVRSRTPVFALTWTAIHPITTESPLYRLTADDFENAKIEIVVTLTGIDETFSQTIYSRHSYIASEIYWNRRFVDILSVTAEGKRSVDYTRFHEVQPDTHPA